MTSSPARVAEQQTTPGSLKRALPFLCSAVAILLYLWTLKFEFVYDDVNQIVNNPLIRSWHNVLWLFKTDVWRFLNPHVVGNYWRPLFMVWLLANYKLFGTNPAGWHLMSALLHGGVTYLSYQLARRMGASELVAGAAALLFAVHPVHLETVAWVSGATDSLMSIFFFGALLCFMRAWQKRTGMTWFLASGVMYGCALLTKETAIVLPAIALVIACIHRHPSESVGTVAKKFAAPLLIFAAVFGVYWLGRLHALAGIAHSRFQISIPQLVMTWPTLAWFYLKLLAWPVGLGVFYDVYPVIHPTFGNFVLPAMASVLFMATLFAAWRRTREKLIPIAVALLVIPMLPAFVFPALVPTDFAHDRYLYLPCLGFTLLVGVAVERLMLVDRARWLAALTITFVLSVASLSQMVFWANNLLLFTRATKVAPSNMVGFDSLGEALAARGRKEDAAYIFEQVLKQEPNNWSALYNLGLINFLDGNNRATESYMSRATLTYSGDGDSLAILAEAQLRQGKFGESESSIRKAISAKPFKPGYRRVLALALEGEGRISEARLATEEELKLAPNDEETNAIVDRLKTR